MILDKMPADLRAVHFCPVCSTAYDSLEEATKCAARSTNDTGLDVGDIVIPEHGDYHWHDGLDHWVHSYEMPNGKRARGSPGPDGRGERKFYYVVTAIGCYADVEGRRPFYNAHPSGHDTILYVHTLGIKNGMDAGRAGWTTMRTHKTMRKVANPPALVVEESRAYLGERVKHLL